MFTGQIVYLTNVSQIVVVIRWDENAGLLYLLRFEQVDNLGAYRIPPETGILMEGVYACNRLITSVIGIYQHSRRFKVAALAPEADARACFAGVKVMRARPMTAIMAKPSTSLRRSWYWMPCTIMTPS